LPVKDHSNLGMISKNLKNSFLLSSSSAICLLLVIVLSSCSSGQSSKQEEQSEPISNTPCGTILKENYKLDGNLQCSTQDKVGLIISGDNLIIDGSNYEIKASDAEIGLLIIGKNNIVKNFKISGLQNGTAILLHENTQVQVTNNTLKNNSIGIDVYNNEVPSGELLIANNDVSDSLIGIRIRDNVNSAFVNSVSPVIKNNNLSRARLYALQVKADVFTLTGEDNNNFSNSANGAFLQGRNIKIENLDLGSSLIRGTAIFINETENFSITQSNLSLDYADLDSYGIHLYRVQKADLDGLSISNRDVGIKVATDSNIETQFTLQNSSLSFLRTAAIMVQSYDETVIDSVKVLTTLFEGNVEGYDLWIVPGTVVRNQ
jgi:nitrous oxidase accessory protein NosD